MSFPPPLPPPSLGSVSAADIGRESSCRPASEVKKISMAFEEPDDFLIPGGKAAARDRRGDGEVGL